MPRARRKEARPGELLAAALDVFAEKGFAATRVDEVAARAGVSKGTLFLYFSSKEELFKAVVRENLSGRFVEWDQELEQFQGSTAELLRYCFETWWERIGSTQASALGRLMLCEANNFPELAQFYRQEVIEPGHALVRRVLQRGMQRGEFRLLELEHAVYLVLAPLMFLMLARPTMGLCIPCPDSFDAGRYIALQADNVLQGLLVRPA
ncbi:transcriptional regulator, TetR family [Oryzisolibacter propanilivorax]|uniref:Transcriptional regulator, TetR family n=1 Tax=Oryzisolibacter propanilivorax TaxID=1527607 RepID=A0A1G9PHM9_9BURK|nr:TetR/AcrR family transcriptional regulator [Oryzisolibacter propanilivorax]SDL98043.1 transcriptional regulator, TetR family [Oryzisolibacter propanilivorax]